MFDQTVSARLVFANGPLPNQAELLELTRDVLTRAGMFGGADPRLSGDGRMLYAAGLCCRIDETALPSVGGRVRVTMARQKRSDIAPQSDQPSGELHLSLARLVVELVDRFSADRVEWLNANASLSRAEILSALRYVSPRRSGASSDQSQPRRPDLLDRLSDEMTTRQTGPEVQMPQEIDGWEPAARNLARIAPPVTLDIAAETATDTAEPKSVPQPDASLPLRSASWLITGVVATLSLPVAGALACYSMLRGSDFRITTQALVLVGLFVTLTT